MSAGPHAKQTEDSNQWEIMLKKVYRETVLLHCEIITDTSR